MQSPHLSRYDSYKSTEIGWVPEIPNHWKVKPLAAAAQLISDTNRPELELLSVYLGRGVIRFSDVDEKRTNATSADLSKYQVVRPGNLVLNNQQAWRGSVGVSEFEGIVSPAYIVLKLSDDFDRRFANYYFQTPTTVSDFLVSSKGVGTIQRNLYWPALKRCRAIVPPVAEQKSIAHFLDQKTAKLDQAIRIKEGQIALLRERRQIVIQDAVTKGLYANTACSDSGIEWIGQIPSHWDKKRLKYVTKIVKRIIGREGPDVLSVTQRGITVKDIDSGEGQLAADYSNYQIVEIGDFAMNHMDLITGYVDISKHFGVTSPDYRVFKNVSSSLDDRFLLLLFQMGYKSKIFFKYGQGVHTQGRWRFPAESFQNFVVPIPPLSEQRLIVQHVGAQSAKIDEAILQKEQQITTLKEYKTTLINAAVTGKIKVA